MSRQVVSDDHAVDTVLDLAEGERLLAAFKAAKQHAIDSADPKTGMRPTALVDVWQSAEHKWVDWRKTNGEPLVAALKAAQQREVDAAQQHYQKGWSEGYGEGEIVGQAELARVEAERDQLIEQRRGLFETLEFANGIQDENERLQARIAELEAASQGSLDPTIVHLEQRIAELEGSLRPFARLADMYEGLSDALRFASLQRRITENELYQWPTLGEARRARAMLENTLEKDA